MTATIVASGLLNGFRACDRAGDGGQGSWRPDGLDDRRRQRGPLSDPLFGQISEFPDQVPIDRVSTNAWADIKPAVEATGRKVLVMAGIWTEVCLAQTALSAIKDGYTVTSSATARAA